MLSVCVCVCVVRVRAYVQVHPNVQVRHACRCPGACVRAYLHAHVMYGGMQAGRLGMPASRRPAGEALGWEPRYVGGELLRWDQEGEGRRRW